MGASWRRLAAPVLLLALAAAWAPAISPAQAGSADDPEVADEAGDQAVDTGTAPVVPGVNDPSFDDVDILHAWVTQFANLTRITVQTAAGWTSGTMALTFNVTRGPASLPSSTATAAGTPFTVVVEGTAVSGVTGGAAAATTDGLRVHVPTSALGAVGGDRLADLAVATARTDPGRFQLLEHDDQTGSDAAGPGRAYTFARPAAAGRIRLDILGGTAGEREFTGSSATGHFPSHSTVRLRLTNDGLDPDDVDLRVSRPGSQPVASNVTQPVRVGAGESRDLSVELVFPNEGPLPAGTTNLTFAAASGLGGRAIAVLRVTVPGAPEIPGEREVKPAGLTFLTGGAEAMGLDGPFGPYAEAFLLALIVLLALLAIYLLLALGRSTLAGGPAEDARWPGDAAPAAAAAAPAASARAPRARAGPAGLAQTVRAARRPAAPRPEAPAAAPAPEPDDDAMAPPLSPTLAAAAGAGLPTTRPGAGGAIRIEDVRHEPEEPEAGQKVVTEVLLRNDGPTSTLRLTLSVDGQPAAERTVQVPSRATKAVELPWTAGPGDNRVRIQAFPA